MENERVQVRILVFFFCFFFFSYVWKGLFIFCIIAKGCCCDVTGRRASVHVLRVLLLYQNKYIHRRKKRGAGGGGGGGRPPVIWELGPTYPLPPRPPPPPSPNNPSTFSFNFYVKQETITNVPS